MRVLGVLLILLIQAYPPGEDVFPVGGDGPVAPVAPAPAVTCPCWDATTAAARIVAEGGCGTGLDPNVAALCALGYVWETCTVGAPSTMAFFAWDAGALTCTLSDGGFATIASGAGLSAAEIAKCIADAEAGVVALGIAGCTPS